MVSTYINRRNKMKNRYAVQTYHNHGSRLATRLQDLETAIIVAKDIASKISHGSVGVWDSVGGHEVVTYQATRVSGQEAP